MLNDELPDAADPPGARWERWAAGPLGGWAAAAASPRALAAPAAALQRLLGRRWAAPGQAAAPASRRSCHPCLSRPGYRTAYPSCLLPASLLPACLPADGRYWVAGVAQGVSANPYERRLVTSARRKPVVVGPRSIAVVVDGEGHTLAGAVTDVAWLK